MPDRRQQLVSALKTRLALIVQGNTISQPDGTTYTFQTSVGAKVFEWDSVLFQEAELPVLTVRDVTLETVPPEKRLSQFRERLLRVAIGISASETDGTATVLRNIITDILRVVGHDEYFGELAKGTERSREDITVDEESARITGAQIILDIYYDSPKWGEE